MKILKALVFSLAAVAPVALDAATLTYAFDPGPMVLNHSNGNDLGPTYDPGVLFWSFHSHGHLSPQMNLRGATVEFCNWDRGCGPGGSFGSRVLVMRGKEELYRSEIDDTYISYLPDRWFSGIFGTVYTKIRLEFDRAGHVTDWGWFIDNDSHGDISNTERSYSYNHTGDYDYEYVSTGSGSWTRTGSAGSFLAPIPLPASLPLLAIGVAALAGVRRRRHRRQHR